MIEKLAGKHKIHEGTVHKACGIHAENRTCLNGRNRHDHCQNQRNPAYKGNESVIVAVHVDQRSGISKKQVGADHQKNEKEGIKDISKGDGVKSHSAVGVGCKKIKSRSKEIKDQKLYEQPVGKYRDPGHRKEICQKHGQYDEAWDSTVNVSHGGTFP